jgi:LPXTG-motif cell wall-anchored protein
MKLENGSYVPYCYPGDEPGTYTNTPVVIQSGQAVSVRTGQMTPVEYEAGKYKFMELEKGTYAVRFSSDSQDFYNYTACETDRVENKNDDVDSDAEPIYESQSGNGLKYTKIEGIVMPAADSAEMYAAAGVFVSRNNDSGFYYTKYELPLTGGAGTVMYYILGAVMAVPALAGLRRRKKHEANW